MKIHTPMIHAMVYQDEDAMLAHLDISHYFALGEPFYCGLFKR